MMMEGQMDRYKMIVKDGLRDGRNERMIMEGWTEEEGKEQIDIERMTEGQIYRQMKDGQKDEGIYSLTDEGWMDDERMKEGRTEGK